MKQSQPDLLADEFDAPEVPGKEAFIKGGQRPTKLKVAQIRINFDLDKAIHKRLAMKALQQEETVADIMRRLIDEYLSR